MTIIVFWVKQILGNFFGSPTRLSFPKLVSKCLVKIFVISLIYYYYFLKPSLYKFLGSLKQLVKFWLTPDHPFFPKIKQVK